MPPHDPRRTTARSRSPGPGAGRLVHARTSSGSPAHLGAPRASADVPRVECGPEKTGQAGRRADPMAGRFACPRPCAIGLPASRRIRARTWRARCWATIEGYRRHAVAGTGFMRTRTEQAIELMMGFAERTGLTAGRPHQRYLWTDAFAVCNFLWLAHVTGEPRFPELASSWSIRCTTSSAGIASTTPHRLDQRAHRRARRSPPDRGGLRIGKPLPERRPDEPSTTGSSGSATASTSTT